MAPPASARDRAPAPDRRRLAVPLVLMASVVCVVVLLVAGVGLAGGLEEVSGDELPRFAVEETIEGEPWNVTVIDAALYPDDALEPTVWPSEGHHWLVVLAEIEITADRTFGNISTALDVPGMDGLRVSEDLDRPRPLPAQVRRIRDTTQVYHLEPGLPERLLFLWERSGEAAPADVEVQVIRPVFRRNAQSRHEQLWGPDRQWLDFDPRARVVVPLKDRRDEEL